MWQIFLFGGIALVIAVVVLNEIRSWRRGSRGPLFDRTADESTNRLIAEQQAASKRNSGMDFGGSSGPLG